MNLNGMQRVATVSEPTTPLSITPEKNEIFARLRDEFIRLRENTMTRLNVVLLLEENSALKHLESDLENVALSESSYEQLKAEME